jgi:hypothetical protein
MVSIEIIHNSAQIMLSAPTPDNNAPETLSCHRVKRCHNHCLMQFLGKVNIAAPKVAMLRRRPKWKCRQNQHLGTLDGACLGRSQADSFHKPGIKIYRQVRTLLLGAASW